MKNLNKETKQVIKGFEDMIFGGNDRRWKCKLCGRDKFTAKTSHNCNNGFRKRKIIWEPIIKTK